jgi:signal transduction histidine kinase
MTLIPLHLQERLHLFIAEEVTSTLRHSVVNDLTGLGALCYRLKIEHAGRLEDRLDALSGPELLANIQRYVKSASHHLAGGFLPEPLEGALADVVSTASRLLARMPPPDGVAVDGPASGALLSARIEAGELELALACLLANAFEAAAPAEGHTARVRCEREGLETLRIEIAHDGPAPEDDTRDRMFDPFFSTKPGRLGLGLNIVRRIAGRWGGLVELDVGEKVGVVTRLTLPATA